MTLGARNEVAARSIYHLNRWSISLQGVQDMDLPMERCLLLDVPEYIELNLWL